MMQHFMSEKRYLLLYSNTTMELEDVHTYSIKKNVIFFLFKIYIEVLMKFWTNKVSVFLF